MKKRFKIITFLSILLIVITSSFSLFSGCDKEKEVNYLVKDAKTDYKIAVASDASGETLLAADELKTFLEASTSARISVVDADNLVHSKELKVISIGNNKLVKTTQLNIDIAPQYFEINTLDNSIYVVGGDDFGNLYGVYELLERLIDFKVYAADEIAYESSSDIVLPNYSIKDGPDFEYRSSGNKHVTDDAIYSRRLRQSLIGGSDVWLTGRSHNYSEYFNLANDDPNWKNWSDRESEIGHTACLNANGNAESAEAMKQRVVDTMIMKLQNNPNGTLINFSQPDLNIWCRCAVCKADYEKYGTDSVTVIKFVNEVSDRVIAWLKENDPYRADKVKFVFLGYHKTQEPPVKANADGTYSPISDELKLNKQVGVFLAPVFASYNLPVENSVVGELVKKWSAVSQNVFMWVYQTNFSHHLYPYNSTGYIQENFEFYLDHNVKYILNHGQSRPPRSTGFHEFKAWLDAKLMWDSKLDVTALTKDYFDNMFRSASKPMYEFYMAVSNYMIYLEQELLLGGSVYQSIHDAKYWPKGVADSFMRYVEEAYKAIEIYKETDPALYNKLEQRITRESLFPRYVLLDLYSGYYSADELFALRKEYMQDCLRLEVTLVSEWVSIYDGVFKKWGL
ncbi:MAG: DUF4838 domain-containing protein [Clostridia bacterium]|nr:DUF4838 domain-containing protein [Clostridia bacterium]